MDVNSSHESWELYDLNKKELEQIEKEEINSQMIRSKIRWTEEGEKNSKYFLSLENKIYNNKLITTLETIGNIIKDPIKIAEAQSEFYQGL